MRARIHLAIYDALVASLVQQTGVPFLSVDYRLSPEHPGTTLVDDSFAALRWMHERSEELGIDGSRIAVMGDSGGGGVAAGVAVAARDRDVPIARQILIYPMLDHRNLRPDSEIEPFLTWTYDNNFTGWHALLGEAAGRDGDVSPLASPSVVDDVRGLAPAYIEVGKLDIFRDESIAYAARLVRAGVSTELVVRRGVPHAFERLAPTAGISRRAVEDRVRVIQEI